MSSSPLRESIIADGDQTQFFGWGHFGSSKKDQLILACEPIQVGAIVARKADYSSRPMLIFCRFEDFLGRILHCVFAAGLAVRCNVTQRD
jgi:hypothetical protein